MNEIDDLLERIDVPQADVDDDVARGERAVRRRHRWQAAAAAVSVAVLAGGGAVVAGHGGQSRAAGFSGRLGSDTSATPSQHAHSHAHSHAQRRAARKQRQLKQQVRRLHHSLAFGLSHTATLREYRDILAEHLDPTGAKLRFAQNEQGGSGTLGTKLDWNHGGMLEIVVGPSWGAAAGFYLLEDSGMSPTTYDGRPAKVSTTGADLVVSVEHADGTVVTLIASTGFGNNGTSTPELGLDRHQLLAAAADPRLVLPPHLS
jgi:hypothetical protein